MSATLVLTCAVLVFRGVVRRQYQRHGRLRWWATLTQPLVFSLWAAFGYLQLPATWPDSDANRVLGAIGWVLFAGGVTVTLLAGIRLGAGPSFGVEQPSLRTSGLYRVVRNPQASAFGVALMGHTLIWPTWKLAGALLLYFPIVHLMVLAEEEHLARALGDTYREYQKAVPRYLPWRGGRKGITP
jgi:protein-S-isoprenylcysteine O-methyltransferase Ste14